MTKPVYIKSAINHHFYMLGTEMSLKLGNWEIPEISLTFCHFPNFRAVLSNFLRIFQEKIHFPAISRNVETLTVYAGKDYLKYIFFPDGFALGG